MLLLQYLKLFPELRPKERNPISSCDSHVPIQLLPREGGGGRWDTPYQSAVRGGSARKGRVISSAVYDRVENLCVLSYFHIH